MVGRDTYVKRGLFGFRGLTDSMERERKSRWLARGSGEINTEVYVLLDRVASSGPLGVFPLIW